MNNIQIFKYENNDVRTVEMNGEPWFVLKDVCVVLGLGTVSKVADRLDADEKGMNQIHTPGGMQDVTVINESGLYNVILRSDKPVEVKLGLTTRQIRTALSKLISTNEVTKKSTSKFTIYTINNYADYQACDKQNDKRATNERQTSDKPSNTKKVRSKEYIATTAASDAGCDLHNQDLSDCIQCYEQNCGSIPRAVSDEIKAALQKFPSAIICQAIEEAAVHNSRRWSYICLRILSLKRQWKNTV